MFVLFIAFPVLAAFTTVFDGVVSGIGVAYDEFVRRVPGARGALHTRWGPSSDSSGAPRRSDAVRAWCQWG